ncbi:hypothetical protein [Thalassoroseus pseudoceratinae]|uniref:hypothetical protein n=1 Tax=Thalassoroseus pseudoceratinae TaxID=2713176 RepID=UPI0014214977|nr:hypothetical protein [Thalassoroseus pseudoceratinae]
MPELLRFLHRPLTSVTLDAKAGQLVSWFAALLVLILGFYKVVRLPLSETELFFGLLLVATVSLLCVLIGLVLPLAVRHETNRE